MRSALPPAAAFLAGIVCAWWLLPDTGAQAADDRLALEPLRGSTGAGADAVGAPAGVSLLAPLETTGVNASLERPPELESVARAPRAIDPGLQAALEREVADAIAAAGRASKGKANAGNCTVAFQVLDLERDVVVAERSADALLEPASNLKLLTTLAALVALGPDWRFRTVVVADGSVSAGVLDGDLVVRAAGDPLFVTGAPGHARRRLDGLAEDLVEAGLRRVTGSLVLDLGSFDAPGPAAGWPDARGWTGSYAYVAGLTANGGNVQLDFDAGRDGRTSVRMWPAPNDLQLTGTVRSVDRDVNDVRIGVQDARRRLETTGELGRPGRTFGRDVRHPDPPAMFAALFSASLQEAGVRIDGGRRRGSSGPGAVPLAVLETRWTDYLSAINRDSENGVADAVFLALGAALEGSSSRAAARRALETTLAKSGLETRGLVTVGGSGLSRDNRVTPGMLVQLLRRVHRLPEAVRGPFVESLAVAGRSGTLEKRMRGGAAEGRVRAKTGFIVGASGLSGYVDSQSGRQYAFSILVGYPRLSGLNNRAWKPMHDAIAERLASGGGVR